MIYPGLAFIGAVAVTLVGATTSFANSSLTTVTNPMPTSSGSDKVCCAVFINSVGINLWYSNAVQHTKETIITQYLKYNNTIVPTTTTAFNNVSATYITENEGGYEPYTYSGIPTDLVVNADGEYAGTVFVPSTIWSYGSTTFASPTPFASVPYFFLASLSATQCFSVGPLVTDIAFTSTVSGSASYSYSYYTISSYSHDIVAEYIDGLIGPVPQLGGWHGGDGYTLTPDDPYFFHLPEDLITSISPAQTASSAYQIGPSFNFDFPSALRDWLALNPSIRSMYPYIDQCTGNSAGGAPSYLIPVSEVTAESVTTINMKGVYTGTSNTPSTTPTAQPVSLPTSNGAAPSTTPPATTTTTLPTSSSSSEQSVAPTAASTKEDQSQPATSPNATSGKPSTTEEQSTAASTVAASAQSSAEPSSTQEAGASSTPNSSTTEQNPTAEQSTTTVPATEQSGSSPGIQSAPSQTASFTIPVVLGSASATALSSGGFVIAGQTLTKGGSVIASGTTYVLPSSGSAIVVNGQTTAIAPQPVIAQTSSPLVFDSAIATALSSGGFVVEGQTLTQGGAVTVAGTTYALPSSGSSIVINGQTTAFRPEASPTVILGSATALHISSSAYVLGSQTLVPGSTITVSGTTYALPSSGNSVIINGQTTTIAAAATYVPGITLGTQVYTPHPASASVLVIGSQTLSAGGSAITISGQTVSVPASASSGVVVVNGQTTTFSGSEVVAGSATLMVSQSAVTGVIVGSQTLLPGGSAVVVNGETVSAATGSGGGVVVVSGMVTSTEGLGGYINSGLGGGDSTGSTTESSPAQYTGEAARIGVTCWWLGGFLTIVVGLWG